MENFILKKRSIWFHIIVTYFTLGIWAILYFYFKNKNTKQTVNTSNQKLFDTTIAGVTFDNRQDLLKKCSINQKVFIKWEKDNIYSKTGHALAVFTIINNKMEQLGYIPDLKTNELFRKCENQFNNNISVEGYISKITGGTQDKPTLGCVIKIII